MFIISRLSQRILQLCQPTDSVWLKLIGCALYVEVLKPVSLLSLLLQKEGTDLVTSMTRAGLRGKSRDILSGLIFSY